MMSRSRFWKNKRVLVTGYSGFLGSHLTKTLLGRGARIWGLDVKSAKNSTILANKDLKKIKKTIGTIEDFKLVSRIIKGNKIGFIFHLAAEPLVVKCLKNPLKTFSVNIKGTWNILEASRNAGSIKAIIVASSDKAYGIQKRLPYKEDAPLAGCHPYDASKSCADLLSYTYFHTYNLPVCITRCGNIFGPGDINFSRIIPDAIRSALQSKTLLIRSNGRFIRDYIYIDDVVNGYITLAEQMKKSRIFGEAFNFSNEKPISVLDLVKIIFKACDKKLSCKILNKAKYEIRNQYLSAEKAKKVLGWEPRYTLEEGLKKTINWHKKTLRIK